MKIQSTPLVNHPAIAEWCAQVGQLVLNCGGIEACVNCLFLFYAPSEAEAALENGMGFARRSDAVKAAIREHEPDSERRRELCAVLGRAEQTMLRRNAVCHNPIWLTFPDGGDPKLAEPTIVILDMTKRGSERHHVLSIAELRKLVDDSSAIAQALSPALALPVTV